MGKFLLTNRQTDGTFRFGKEAEGPTSRWVAQTEVDRDSIGSAHGLRVGDRSWVRGTNLFYHCTAVTGPMSSTWAPVGGGGGAVTCLDRFLVGKDPAFAPFQSIQAAYDAAKAAGHGPAVPAQVLVCPGIYTETVTIDVAGIDIIAVAQDKQQPRNIASAGVDVTQLAGTVIVTLAAGASIEATTFSWRGIDILPPAPALGAAFAFIGLDPAIVHLSDCRIRNAGAIPCVTSSNPGAGSLLDIQRVVMDSTIGATLALDVDDAEVRCFACGLSAGDDAIEVAAAGNLILDNCAVLGRTRILLGELFAIDTDMQSATEALELTGSAILQRCSLNGFPTVITGTGALVYDTLSFANGAATPWAPTLVAFVAEGLPNEQTVRTVPVPFALTNEITVAVVGDGVTPATLPPLTSRTGPIRVKEAIGSTGAVIMDTPDGATIRVGTAPAGLTATVPRPSVQDTGGMMFVPNLALGAWEAFCFCHDNCLTEFLVAPSALGAPYTSIQVAYDAAVAASRGIGAPAAVLVCPGAYFENVTMSVPQIDIVAVDPGDANELRSVGLGTEPGVTLLVGTLTVLFGAGGADTARYAAWRGVNIDATGDSIAVTFSGTLYQRLYMTDCVIRTGGSDECVLMTNTGTGPSGDSTIDAIRVGLEQTAISTDIPLRVLDGRTIWSDCRIDQLGGSEDVEVAAGAEARFVECAFGLGGDHIVDGDAFYEYCTGIGVLLTGAAGTADARRCHFTTSPIAAGAGAFIYDTFTSTFPGPGIAVWDKSGGLTVTQLTTLPPGSPIQSFGPVGVPTTFTLTTHTNVLVDDSGVGAITIELAPATDRIGPVRVKTTGAAGAPASLIPNIAAADTLNGVVAPIAIPGRATGLTVASDSLANYETY